MNFQKFADFRIMLQVFAESDFCGFFARRCFEEVLPFFYFRNFPIVSICYISLLKFSHSHRFSHFHAISVLFQNSSEQFVFSIQNSHQFAISEFRAIKFSSIFRIFAIFFSPILLNFIFDFFQISPVSFLLLLQFSPILRNFRNLWKNSARTGPGVVLTHSARSGSNGTVCHAVSISSKCSHLRAAPQVFVTTTALSAALCWMSCKCSHHRTALQVFVATTAPCAALCWMSCKCLHLFGFVHRKFSSQPRHPVPRCAGCLASDRIFALHRKLSSEPGTVCRAVLYGLQVLASSRRTAGFRHNHVVPRCAGCLPIVRIFAQHRRFSSQQHLVPRCAECLANARIFAQHRTFLSQESTPCRMCQNHSEPNVSEPLRTFTNKNVSSLLECIINLLLSLLACCRVLK